MNRRELLKVVLALPLLRLVRKLPGVANPTVTDAIEGVVDIAPGFLSFHEYAWSEDIVATDFGALEEYATQMGRAARLTLESYVLGVTDDDGRLLIRVEEEQ